MTRTLASKTVPRQTARARLLGLAGMLAAGALSGCANVDRTVATSTIPTDYRERHPIVLADAPQRLDVFRVPRSGGLDQRQRRDIAVFAQDYAHSGNGHIVALVPRGTGDEPAVRATLEAVRREFVAAGLKGTLDLGSYEVSDPALAAPIRLVFSKLQARAPSRCGEWPDDLGSGSTLQTWENKPYYNFGCATQQNLAAQVADPRDLVRPRAEDPSDVQMRTRAIGNVRQGIDPGTTWVTHNSSISTVGN